MPPFEYTPESIWAAIHRLADEHDQSWRFTKKGDKRPHYDVEASKAGRQRTIKAKRDAAWALAETRRKARRVRPGQDLASRMLRTMAPGEWYGMGDLMRLAGVERYARGKVHQVMLRRGWIEQAVNPAYTGERLSPIEIMAGGEPQPQHLYRMTPEGEAHQRGLQGRGRTLSTSS